MNTSALVIMLTTMTLVTGLMIFFFVKVITTPPKPEPDSYLDNDDEAERQVPNR
ncbi:hypothetical protein [Pontibacter harenae]|uniref:hypothetical protein n=1 Tax=Pontibacter harenae TaxID=2894083 RepID=UPI001E488685|nr:hypothetical protein [Pontibacter harenae]MCC9165976.1 hypothetical protein [Pontibacter harenae]